MKMHKIYILKLLFVLIISSTWSDVFAQADTSYFKRTPLTKIISKQEGLAQQTSELIVQALRINDIHRLKLTVQSGRSGDFYVDSADDVKIMLADSNSIALKVDNRQRSAFGGMGFGNFITLDLELSDEQYELLHSGIVQKIEVPYSEGIFLFELNDQAALVFKETMGGVE
ncbi:hypothetical protein INP83_10960 [Mucilaginibacter sp. 21P]|uniref:hypothetical protein n=1 Tax=Mucilaginibacter sp. 21P TaxID=2778902 RepID=UPI001C585AA6|nr:hypothetical protein [Mucilaginibacter sp. 21P]QXV63637.1 hypothetical protein INP83_10960 [Mucilaginibacter sp. 21P]